MPPYQLPSPCITPGCPALSTRARCPRHELEHKRARNRHHNARRPSPALMGYGHEWRKIRARVLAGSPLCLALRNGRTCGRKATEVDHVTPLRAGGTHDRRNLRALCKSCHSRVTAIANQLGHPR